MRVASRRATCVASLPTNLPELGAADPHACPQRGQDLPTSPFAQLLHHFQPHDEFEQAHSKPIVVPRPHPAHADIAQFLSLPAER